MRRHREIREKTKKTRSALPWERGIKFDSIMGGFRYNLPSRIRIMIWLGRAAASLSSLQENSATIFPTKLPVLNDSSVTVRLMSID